MRIGQRAGEPEPHDSTPEATTRRQSIAGYRTVADTVQTADGAELYYEIHGEGPPMLVVHGGPGLDQTYFRPWFDPLARDFELVYVDLRGSGRSGDVPPERLTHDMMVADLETLRDALGLGPWAVMGHSYGGYVVQEYALEHPAAVSRLLLSNTAPSSPLGVAEKPDVVAGDLAPEVREAIGRYYEPGLRDEEFREIRRAALPLYFSKRDHYERFLAADRVTYKARAFYWTHENNRATFDRRPELHRLEVPTLIHAGRHDRVVPVSKSEILHGSIRTSRLEVFEESGHYPFVEQQAEFLESVRGFLRGAMGETRGTSHQSSSGHGHATASEIGEVDDEG